MAQSAVLFALLISYAAWHVSAFDCTNSQGEKLQVHIVPHTHDDTGWQVTVDQYYVLFVQYILDSVVTELAANPDRKFIYVEIAFFKRWWDEQNDKMKNIVRGLVKSGQLEFINGGWCMNDEATSHYNAIIDQMTLGLRFIDETFGSDARPTVAWQIDPFGHSAEQASLFSMMSFDGLFFGRLDWADKRKRQQEKRMEMLWRGSRNLEKSTQIFTGVLYNLYMPPRGFCWNQDWCGDAPMQDDPNLFDMNVKERVDSYVREACAQAKSYKTNHIMQTMGADFNYRNAHMWYKNLDKLIRYVNEDGRINAFYSTPSIYMKALHETGTTFGTKTDDFFPYSHCPHCFWTGYFTSRPTMKGYIRESNKILQVCKQMEVIQGSYKQHPSSDFLRRAVAVNQHHDAVTGTEKQHVTYDYAKRLYIGRKECQGVIRSFINRKSTKLTQHPPRIEYQFCEYLNISVCGVTESDNSVVINMFNPIARPVITYIRIPVNTAPLISGSNGEKILYQLAPVSNIDSRLRGRQKKGAVAFELTFPVSLPPLGFTTYFLNQTLNNEEEKIPSYKTKRNIKSNNIIENDKLRLEFSSQTGRLIRMTRKDVQLSVNVDQQFLWYEGSVGDKSSRQTSGAYVFRPKSGIPKPVYRNNKARVEIIKGPLVEEVRQTFGPFVSQVIRLYKTADYAEFEYTVGPIPVQDKIGKEIITKFKTDIDNNDVFYTDANGREIKKRVRDFRETWKINATAESVSSNYYPINSRIYINDSRSQFTVMTDRSQGGSSMKNGDIEVMLHRRLLRDDFLGVGEALNETGVDGKGLITRGKQRILLSTLKEASKLHRHYGEAMMMEPVASFAKNPYTRDEWKEKFIPVYSALSRPLSESVHLLTMESTNKDNEVILRFEHLYAKDEDPILSAPVSIDLNELFTDFIITSMSETNLATNQLMKDKKMMQWNTTYIHDGYAQYNGGKYNGDKFVLQPMEIKTFLVNIKRTL